ncbi:MAG: hypothetical protein IJJ33_01745 [Victivallales bacterium]|nr:hypothetical protein [Victivallales bacterium]
MKAGFFECDITPPYGAECPGDFRKRRILKICGPLKVRALALTDGARKVALVGADNVGCGPAFLQELKRRLPGIAVVFSASHVHYGGNLYDKFPGIDTADATIRRIVLEERVSHDPNYYEYCLRQAVTAVTFAFENLQEAEFSFGSARIEGLIFNRRIRMKDGTVRTHAGKGNPDSVGFAGPVDDQLGCMGVWKKGTDELLGFAFNFSCHSCINLEGASADYAGIAIETVRAVYGSGIGAVFMYGAAGDVTQIDNMSMRKDMGRPVSVKLGRAVGAEAVRILATADRGEVVRLECLSGMYRLRPTEIDPAELQEARRKIQEPAVSADYRFACHLVTSDIRLKAEPELLKAELMALQVGPLLLYSAPCEMFAQFALDLKARSRFPFTWMANLSFLLCYIPTADAFDPKTGGGYEASTALFVPETGNEICQALAGLAERLVPEAAPEPETVEPAVQAWGYNFKRKDMN